MSFLKTKNILHLILILSYNTLNYIILYYSINFDINHLKLVLDMLNK